MTELSGQEHQTAQGGPVGVDPALQANRRKRRGWTERVLTLVLALLLAALIVSVTRNDRFGWGTVADYMFSSAVLRGVMWTLALTGLSAAIAAPIGVVLAVMRLSKASLAQRVSWTYVWFFRSIPGLVQLLFWFNIAALYPTLKFGIPFGPSLWEANANTVITPLIAAVVGLTLHEAAYFAEIFRGSLLSVDEGQSEAGRALGMSPSLILRRITLPQATRVAIPASAGQVIHLLKATSLVSVIGMTDLLWSVQLVYFRTFQTVPLLIVACIWYLVITSALGVVQSWLEKRYGRGNS
jgi:polar amino acid transport system permease protein